MAPVMEGQVDVIRQAWDDAGVALERLGYLESFTSEPEASPEPSTPPAVSAEADRRLAWHPSERETLRGFAKSTMSSRPMDLAEMYRLWAAEVSDE